MKNLHYVRLCHAENRGELSQRAGDIGKLYLKPYEPSALYKPLFYNFGKRVYINVSAAYYNHSVPFIEPFLSFKKPCKSYSPRALYYDSHSFSQKKNRILNFALINCKNIIHVFLNHLKGDCPCLFNCNSIGNGLR